MSKTAGQVPKDKLDLYDQLLQTIPEIERKGASMPYTSLNGNMYSYLADGKLALRLPTGAREAFLKKYETTLVEAYGIVQKEYVAVPDALFQKTDELQPYMVLSYEYAKTLKPKRTTKARKKP